MLTRERRRLFACVTDMIWFNLEVRRSQVGPITGLLGALIGATDERGLGDQFLLSIEPEHRVWHCPLELR